MKSILFTLLFGFVLLPCLAAQPTPEGESLQEGESNETAEGEAIPAPMPMEESRREEWKTHLDRAEAQLRLLQLFSRVSQVTEMAVPIPKTQQRIPLEDMEGMEETAKKYQIFLQEIRFHKIQFDQKPETLWLAEHPVLPILAQFQKIHLKVHAVTPLGKVDLVGIFEDGKIPVDLDVFDDRLEIIGSRPYRQEEGAIKTIKFESRPASHPANGQKRTHGRHGCP